MIRRTYREGGDIRGAGLPVPPDCPQWRRMRIFPEVYLKS